MKWIAAICTSLSLVMPVSAQVQGVMLDEPVTLPEFAFSNELGESFTSDDTMNAWTLVMFGF